MKLFWPWLLFFCLKANCETQVFEAVVTHQGKPAYFEKHSLTLDGSTLIQSNTIFYGQKGEMLGSLRSDFTHSLAAPDYVLKDLRHGSAQGSRWNNGILEVMSRDKNQKRVIKNNLPPNKELMMGGEGLIYYLAAHLEEVIALGGINFQYIIPTQAQTYDFFVRPIIKNQDQVEFEVVMKSWFKRLFSPRIKLVFDLKNKRLKSYSGLSHLRSLRGEMMNVEVQYVYKN